MSTTIIIILVFLCVLVGFITVNYFRMKNAKPIANSKKIRVLNNKNYKTISRKGVWLVDFSSASYAPCKAMIPVLNDIAETNDDFGVAKVNVEHNQQMAKKFKVQSIPTMLVLKNGKECARIVGIKTKRTIMKEVRAVMS